MKKNILKKTFSFLVAMIVAGSVMTSSVNPAHAKTISSHKSILVGQTITVKVKKGKKQKSSDRKIATVSKKYTKKKKKVTVRRKGKKIIKWKKVKVPNGKFAIRGIRAGQATITIRSGKKTYKFKVTVKNRPVSRQTTKTIQPKPKTNPAVQEPKKTDFSEKPKDIASQTMSEAEKQNRLSELKAELEKKQALLENAKSSQTSSKKTLENATAQYVQTKKAYDEAQKTVKEGSLGFFRSINAQGAIQLLTRDNIEKTSNENVNSFTHMGADEDATSLEGMKDSLDAFREYEELVKREGLALPRVSTILTAIEQLNCNFYMNNIDYELTHESPHTTWGNKYGKSSECLAVVTGLPFKAWYDDEKEIYEKHKDEFFSNPNEAGRKYRVGHYFTIKKGSTADRYMGMGRYHGASALGYSLTPCHVSTTIERKDIEDYLNSLHITNEELNEHYEEYVKDDTVNVREMKDGTFKVTQTTRTAEDLTMSLSEYREKFMAYYNRYVTAPAKEMNEKKAAMDSADKEVKKTDSEIASIENDIRRISESIETLEK